MKNIEKKISGTSFKRQAITAMDFMLWNEMCLNDDTNKPWIPPGTPTESPVKTDGNRVINILSCLHLHAL
jgi:hypothetical protein